MDRNKDAITIGESVRQKIEDAGLRQGDVADRAHMDPTALNKSLHGTRPFKLLELSWIASILGVSVDEAMGNTTLPFMAAARATGSADAHVDDEIREVAQLMYERRWGLNELGIGNTPNLPDVSTSMSDRQIAAVLVEAINAHTGGQVVEDPADLATILENAFDIDVWLLPLPQGIDGYAIHAPDSGVYGIIATTRTSAQRIRFTIVHELVHLVLGDDTTNSPHSITPEWEDTAVEQRANAIAGRVLMPDGKVPNKDTWTPADIRLSAYELRVAPSAFAARVGASMPDRITLRSAFRGVGRDDGAYDAWQRRSKKERKPQRLMRDLAKGYTSGETTVRPFALVAGLDDTEEARRTAESLAPRQNAA